MQYNHFSYMEKLARRLKAVAHTDNDCHFFRATEQTELEELTANISSVHGTIIIAIDGSDISFNNPDSDNLVARPEYMVVVASQTESTDSATIIDAQKKCSEISLQIIAKILQDAQAFQNGCRYVDEKSFNVEGIGPIADNFYGVILSFSLEVGLNFQIDAEMWSETDAWDCKRN